MNKTKKFIHLFLTITLSVSINVCADFCTKLRLRSFESIDLKSFTPFDDKWILMFESSRYYVFPISYLPQKLSSGSFQLARPRVTAGFKQIEGIVKSEPDDGKHSIRAIYFLRVDEDSIIPWRSKKQLANIHSTFSGISMWNVKDAQKPVLLWNERPPAPPASPSLSSSDRPILFEYSLVFSQTRYAPSGYVFWHEPSRNNSSASSSSSSNRIFEFARLEIDSNNEFNIEILRAQSGDVARSRQSRFRMERTTNRSEIVIRSFATKKSFAVESDYEIDRRQLFCKLPLGYVHDGSLYLFDTFLGCVYVVRDDFALESNQNNNSGDWRIRIFRQNIPYEQFFQCDKLQTDSDIKPDLYLNRCDIGILPPDNHCGSAIGKKQESMKGNDSNSFWNFRFKSNAKNIFFLLIGTAGLSLAIVTIVFCLQLFFCSKKNKKAKKRGKKKRKKKKKKKKDTSEEEYKKLSSISDPSNLANLNSNIDSSKTKPNRQIHEENGAMSVSSSSSSPQPSPAFEQEKMRKYQNRRLNVLELNPRVEILKPNIFSSNNIAADKTSSPKSSDENHIVVVEQMPRVNAVIESSTDSSEMELIRRAEAGQRGNKRAADARKTSTISQMFT